MKNDYMTAAQLGKRWHMKPTSLANWRAKKIGPKFIKIGSVVRASKVLYKLEDIIKYENKNIIKGKS